MSRAGGALAGATPPTFVVLWSTGYIVALYGLPHAGPLNFLAVRFTLCAAALTVAAFAIRATWPRRPPDIGHAMVAGLLIHGLYLGAVWAALDRGVEAGIAALIIGAQPLLTALAAAVVLAERTTTAQKIGLGLGLLGIVLVVHRKLALGFGTSAGVWLSVLGLLGITIGTVYQKRFCTGLNMVTGNAIQFATAALAMIAAAWLVEDRPVTWNLPFALSVAWSVAVLSLGATTLLYLLIRRGAAAQVASLFYLVPLVTALLAWLAFGETFGPIGAAGMLVTAAGVALVMRPSTGAGNR